MTEDPNASGEAPPLPPPPQPRKPEAPDLKKRVEIHPVWWALGLVILGIGGAVETIKFIDEHITEQVSLRIKPQIIEVLGSDTELARLKTERQQAADALANGTRVEQQATAKWSLAIEQTDNAMRAAKDANSAADQLKNIINTSEFGKQVSDALSDPAFRQQVTNHILPVGAVVAFDTPEGCPDGWSLLEKASGRVLVGAGQNINLDKNGRSLSSYRLGQSGGEESHTLSIAELPPHSVRIFDTKAANVIPVDRYNAGGSNYPVITSGPNYLESEKIGDGASFKIMPPYTSIFYCKKSS